MHAFQLTQVVHTGLSPASMFTVPECYSNALMIQQVLEEPGWPERMTARDLAALSPLITQHINPYGRCELDMETRLPIAV